MVSTMAVVMVVAEVVVMIIVIVMITNMIVIVVVAVISVVVIITIVFAINIYYIAVSAFYDLAYLIRRHHPGAISDSNSVHLERHPFDPWSPHKLAFNLITLPGRSVSDRNLSGSHRH